MWSLPKNMINPVFFIVLCQLLWGIYILPDTTCGGRLPFYFLHIVCISVKQVSYWVFDCFMFERWSCSKNSNIGNSRAELSNSLTLQEHQYVSSVTWKLVDRLCSYQFTRDTAKSITKYVQALPKLISYQCKAIQS